MTFQERLEQVCARIERAAEKASRKTEDVRILAVSKTQSIDLIKEAQAAGLTAFGENYVQEALPKIETLFDLPLEWHFIGHLQSNKVSKVVGEFDCIQSVDSTRLLDKINQQARDQDFRQRIFFEANIADEASKTGFPLDELKKVAEEIELFPFVDLAGLMVFPPQSSDLEETRKWMQKGFRLKEEIEELCGKKGLQLSMGTSQDFEVAIEEGSTMIRLGEVLFGPRQGVH